MKYLYIVFICSFLVLDSQLTAQPLESFVEAKLPQAKSTPNGLFYQLETAGEGKKPEVGDYIKLSFVGKLLDGKTFDESPKEEPLVFQLGKRQVIQGWETGLVHFKKGAKGTLALPSQLAYGKRGVGNIVPPDADLIYEIELIDIMDQEGYDNYMKKEEAKARAAFEKKKRQQLESDKVDIVNYARKNKLKVNRLPSGLSYMIKKKGKKEFAKAGDKLSVAYTGMLLDGTVFDSTEGKSPFEFTLGQGKTIQGWEEGLSFFKRGAEGYLLIPSQLAYGPRPIIEKDINIPGNSVLIFKIKVVEIQ